jgi:radical SAM protein with 4Fe4S-binding SPASM domain
MKAVNLTGKAPTERKSLIEMLPLKTPLVVQIFPFYGCNFKCNYCIFQKPENQRNFISQQKVMQLDNFEKYINDMQKFNQKIKVLRFVGIGEPLLNKNISDMVSLNRWIKVADKTEIVTNGYALNPMMSNSLIDAGLDRLVVSVQGTSHKRYREITGIDIDFQTFVYQLQYFYKYKEDTEVYIKIVDSALEDKEDEQRFYDIFGDICDYIAIEATVPIHNGICLPDRDCTQFGESLLKYSVCPQPFYHVQINPDGNVVPCQSFEYPVILGNANTESIVDIWNGDKFNQFRRSFIEQELNKICRNCNMCKYRIHKEDVLDPEKLAYIMF